MQQFEVHDMTFMEGAEEMSSQKTQTLPRVRVFQKRRFTGKYATQLVISLSVPFLFELCIMYCVFLQKKMPRNLNWPKARNVGGKNVAH